MPPSRLIVVGNGSRSSTTFVTCCIDDSASRSCDLAEDVFRTDVLTAIQNVPGVRYVDLDYLDAIEGDDIVSSSNVLTRARIVVPQFGALQRPSHDDSQAAGTGEQKKELRNACICYLDPNAPDTLLLEAIS